MAGLGLRLPVKMNLEPNNKPHIKNKGFLLADMLFFSIVHDMEWSALCRVSIYQKKQLSASVL